MRLKKENYFILLLAGILLAIIFALVFFIIRSNTAPNEGGTSTPLPTSIVPPIPSQQSVPIDYNTDATNKLVDKVENRPPLSPSDRLAKQSILTLLPTGESSGYIYTSPNVTIEYLKSPDTFLSEIFIENVAQAKEEVVNWFKSQGLSDQGVCDLPVSFFLNWEIANKLRGASINFSPLPDGC